MSVKAGSVKAGSAGAAPGPVAAAVAAPAWASPRVQGLAMVLATACSWGFNWPVTKFLLSELPPFAMRTLCCWLGAALCFAIARRRREALWPPRDQWGRLALFAACNFGAFTILTTLSLVWLPASEAVILTYTLPIWAVGFAWPMLGERPTVARLVAIALGLGGIAVLVGANPLSTERGQLPGVACGLAAAAVFGFGTVIAKRAPLRMPPVAGVGWQAVLGTLPVALLALGEHPHWAGVTALGWGGIFYVAVLPMSLAYLAWFRGLRLLPAATAATAVLLAPVIGVFASGFMLGEPVGLRQVGALAMTLGGVALAARG